MSVQGARELVPAEVVGRKNWRTRLATLRDSGSGPMVAGGFNACVGWLRESPYADGNHCGSLATVVLSLVGYWVIDGERSTGNRFDGTASNVVQAGTIHGDVHLHQPRRDVRRARQVLPPPQHYTNNEPQLDRLTSILIPESDHGGPRVAIIRGAPGSGRSNASGSASARSARDALNR